MGHYYTFFMLTGFKETERPLVRVQSTLELSELLSKIDTDID